MVGSVLLLSVFSFLFFLFFFELVGMFRGAMGTQNTGLVVLDT